MKKNHLSWLVGLLVLVLAAAILFVRFFSVTPDPSDPASGKSSSSSADPISATSFHFDTVVTIKIYDSTDESLLDACMDLCDEYEALFSRTLETSEIYKLNHGTLPKDGDCYILSDMTADLIKKGLEYCRLSDGAFDITIAPVSSLWNFSSEDPTVPSDQDIQEALSLVGWQNVELSGNRIRFLREGMEIDLGGIAKGYIADRLKEYLVESGVQSALIDLGGNVLCIGSRPDGTPFKIGIQKPFAQRNETLAAVSLADKSLVSSGTYERNFELDGVFYHHILDPQTGYPCNNELTSVTIFSDSSADGDGLSTSCFVLGLEKGMELIDSLPDIYALFVTEDGTLHYSEGLSDTFSVSVTK